MGVSLDKNNEMKLTYTGILHNKKGEKIVRVCFEQFDAAGKRRFAEGIVPEGRIDKSEGLKEEEIEQLEDYLRENAAEIMTEARKITGITHWLK